MTRPRRLSDGSWISGHTMPGRGMAWSAFNAHLTNMSDVDLGQKVNRIKESGNQSWRWKPLDDRILSEWGNRQKEQVKKWQLNPPKSPEGYPSPEVRGHHPTSGPMDVLKRRQNTSRGVRSSSLAINLPTSSLNI